MHSLTILDTRLRRRAAAKLGRLFALGLLAPTFLVAQNLTSDAETVELQRFVVTGSNIRRTDYEKIAPVTVINQDAMDVRGGLLPVDLLTSLPSVVNLPENETRLGSSGARGDNANINLRNLGATGTLILVNGRRMAINPMTAGLSQAVNVNQLPTQGIERIEVLRDGASAIYGSDAIGWVINYILKKEFDGAEVLMKFGAPEAGGGESISSALTFGQNFAGERSVFSARSRRFTASRFSSVTGNSAVRRIIGIGHRRRLIGRAVHSTIATIVFGRPSASGPRPARITSAPLTARPR